MIIFEIIEKQIDGNTLRLKLKELTIEVISCLISFKNRSIGYIVKQENEWIDVRPLSSEDKRIFTKSCNAGNFVKIAKPNYQE